jgi:2',3'-cyclic-nucleotide 2'-phosphodiesterase (5'-nucleotidase family)
MITRNFKRIFSSFMIVVILLTMLPTSILAANEVTIAQWDFTSDPGVGTSSFAATGGTESSSATLITSGNRGIPNNSGYYSSTNKSFQIPSWDSGANTKFWQISLSTAGYEKLKISFNSYSSNTGPRNFKLQYSIDNINFTDVNTSNTNNDGAYINTSSAATKNFELPATINNSDKVYLKFLQTSNISVRAGTGTYSINEEVGTAGVSRLFAINITGNEIVGYIPPNDSTIEAVTADPATGVSIVQGSTVTLTTVTTGAAIEYKLNNGSAQIVNSTSAAIIIDEFNQPGNTAVITAKVIKDNTSRVEKTFIYTQVQTEAVLASKTGAVLANTQIELTTPLQQAIIRYIITRKVGEVGQTVDAEATYLAPITLTADMLPAKIEATASLAGYQASEKSTFNYTLDDGTKVEKVYFGQIHSHTTQSDGSGTLAQAYDYAKNTAKLDFFAVTDHSNYFDTASAPVEYAASSTNTKWQEGISAAAAAATNTFISFYAYEMTWTGKVGHMNTFNTEGFVSRNNTKYTSSFVGMKNYYELLKTIPNSFSQFNHPGTTFGDFNGFSNYDAAIDNQISLIEVGNGEGAVGSGGYFQSYEYYTKALDKGWHVAPTNNQDNHKGLWGNANTARTAVVTDDFTKAGIYTALHDMRVYATEDENLKINYTVNDKMLGSILSSGISQLKINVELSDNDSKDLIGRVSIITNGGQELNVQNFTSNSGTYSATLNNPANGYYYIKVVEVDGDIAVTAPVWIGNVEKIGIASVTSSVSMPVTGEPLEISTEIFNNEANPITINAINYKIGENTFATGAGGQQVVSVGTLKDTISYTPTTVGTVTVDVVVSTTLNSTVKTYTQAITLDVRDATKLINIGVDASHLNDYVAGNYSNSMTNFAKLAEEYDVRLVEIKGGITAEKLSGLKGLILTPPNRKTTIGAMGEYLPDEITAIKNFVASGKTLIVCGLADFGDGNTINKVYVKNEDKYHTAYQQNLILEAINSKARIVDDELIDKTNYVPTQNYRLRFKNYNMESQYNLGVNPEQEYSVYSGSSVLVNEADRASVTNIVTSHSTSESLDADTDGKGGIDNPIAIGNIPVLTVENLGNGARVFVAGSVFMSNFEVQATLDNASQLGYSNYNICQNIVKEIAPRTITPIKEVQAAEEGVPFTIQGIVTSNASGFDQSTAFFDSIYVQDNTAGINLFPVSGNYKVGQKVEVTGTVGGYQGEKQLTVKKLDMLDSHVNTLVPAVISTKAASENETRGSLIKVEGIIKSVGIANGKVETIVVNDGSGDARVFIDGYINPSVDLEFLKVGDKISAIGLSSVDTLGKRIRVRDRNEICLVSTTSEEKVINILHTNDSHGRVFPDANNKDMIGIDKIAGINKTTLNSILVDVGDTIHGLPIANTTQGSNIIELMNLAGYDVMIPGNHDFNYGSAKLKEYADAATTNFDIISSNVANKEDKTLFLAATSIQMVDGVKIGFFGLTTTETPVVTNPVNVSSLEFKEYLGSARKAIDILKAQKVDVIVGLTHVSRPDVEALAKELKNDVAVIIDGHDHISTSETVEGVLISSAGQYEANLGKITLTLNSDKDIVSKVATLITKAQTAAIIPNVVVKTRATEMMSAVNNLFNQKVGTSEVLLDSSRGIVKDGIVTNGVRNSEMPLGNIVTDAMRIILNADIAITNGGGLRANIGIGDISKGTLNAVLPFGNYGVVKEVTPKQLKAILENGIANAPNPVGQFPHVSGIKFEYSPNAPAASRITKITVGKTVLDLNDNTTKYRLATNDFMANGGDGYTAIKELKTITEGDSMDVIFENYVRSLPNAKITADNTKIEGRILAVVPATNTNTGTNTGTSQAPLVTTPIVKDTTVVVKPTLDSKTGEATVELTDDVVQKLLENTKANEKAGKSTVIEIQGEATKDSKKITVILDKEFLGKISSETAAGMKIKTGFCNS